MADAAPQFEQRQEFWKPAVLPQEQDHPAEPLPPTCQKCGTDFLIGSRFCYMCGNDREGIAAYGVSRRIHGWLDLSSLLQTLGQSIASQVALVLGCACIVAAIITGFRFTATTLLDWQAIQLWRIEWLLAAIALFAAGILLKKK
jgi:hypothetical protein